MALYDRWRHRYAIVCACATGLLLIAGGLVTSTGSGLAVPDWPLSFGRVFPKMEGGVLFEHGHRLVAATTGLLTIGLTAWFALRERRVWARRLAWIAILAVVAQGLLGGLTVLLRLPPVVSVLHACLAQGFFCVVLLLAVGTSKRFVEGSPEPLRHDAGVPVWTLAAVSTALVFSQLVLGAVMRHTGAGLAIPDVPLAFGRLIPPLSSPAIAVHFAHRVMALVVASSIVVLNARVLKRHADHRELALPALLLAGGVVVQIGLGATTVLTRLAVVPATTHVVVGALLLAGSLVMTVRAWRARPVRTAAGRPREEEAKAIVSAAVGVAGTAS